jgi:AcrR family transcriptional regulator
VERGFFPDEGWPICRFRSACVPCSRRPRCPVTGSTRPLISRDVIRAFRSQRFTDSIAELCLESGYREVTVASVAGRAGTSRNTFYEQFANREECFFAAFERAEAAAFDQVEAACDGAAEDEDRLEAGLRALLGWVAEQPALAHVLVVESLSVGAGSLARHFEAIERFTDLLRPQFPTEVRRPAIVEESLVGGVAAILGSRLRAGGAADVPELLPQLLLFLRAPFLDV